MQERSRRISVVATKQRDVSNQLCVDIYCNVQPRLVTVDLPAVSSTATLRRWKPGSISGQTRGTFRTFIILVTEVNGDFVGVLNVAGLTRRLRNEEYERGRRV